MKQRDKDALLDALFLIEDYIQTGYRRPTDERRRQLETDATRPDAAAGPDSRPTDAAAEPAAPGRAGDRPRGAGEGAAARSTDDAGESSTGRSAASEMPVRSLEERQRELAALEKRVHSCTKCPLHESRTNGVPGTGVLDPLVMVIGEGPGAEEDRQGEPFVGKAGKYLDKWLDAIEMSRESNAYIANIVKCRPPQNRDPLREEAHACIPYLHEQIMLIRPKTILTVGRVAASYLLDTTAGIGTLRGSVYTYRGIPLVPTYHPSGVLRNPEYRRPVWEDLKLLRSVLDE